ncbi:hypothetical protein [Bordetella bronchiseptica]
MTHALKSPTIATEAHQISQLRSTVEDLKKLFRQERGRCGEIRNATLEEAAELADGCDKRATPRGIACAIRAIKSTPAPTAVEGANDVALPPCPQALVKVEGMPRYLWPEMQAYARAAVLADRQRRSGDAPREDDMLTIAYLAGAQAEKERAALSAQPGAIRNPLIAEPSGNPGELERAGDAPREDDMLTIAYLAGAQAEKERAALSAQPGAIRNPLIAEPSGNPGELERAGDAPREDDMLTIAYLAGAQAEKERAALSAQPGAIRNPLIAEPSGNPGELERAGDAPREDDMLTIAYLAGARAEKERAGDVVEALRPFAELEESDLIGTVFQGKGDDEVVLYFHRTGKSITLGDFRRARAALAARKAASAPI